MIVKDILERFSNETGVYIPYMLIRNYEKLGIIKRPKILSNGYREYSEDDYKKIRIVFLMREIGFSPRDQKLFTVSEIKSIIDKKLKCLESLRGFLRKGHDED